MINTYVTAAVVKSFSKTPVIIIFHTFFGLQIHAQCSGKIVVVRKSRPHTHATVHTLKIEL
jgi:hypothetical protein